MRIGTNIKIHDQNGPCLVPHAAPWAGWDHREQALALYGLIEERQNVDGWGTDRVTSLIKGLAEVMPWVRQWHNEVDPKFGQSVAGILDAYLASQRERHGITD